MESQRTHIPDYSCKVHAFPLQRGGQSEKFLPFSGAMSWEFIG